MEQLFNVKMAMIYWNSGLMGMKKKKKTRKGDEEAKPHGRWRDEGGRELEIKACERDIERGDVSWNCKRREILMWQYLKRLKKNLSASPISLYYRL